MRMFSIKPANEPTIPSTFQQYIKTSIVCLAILFFCASGFTQSVIVNKYYNSGSTADKIELLVIQDNLDMRGMIIKNFSSGMNADAGGKFTFTNHVLWSSVKTGTLIILSNDASTTEDLTVSCSDHNLTVKLSNTTYFTNNGGSFDISQTDMIMIKSAGSGTSGVYGSIHVLAGGVEGSEYTAAPTPKVIATGTSGINQYVYVNSSTQTMFDFNGTDATGAATGLTPGVGNNINNTGFINAIRGPDCASCTAPFATVPVNHNFCNGILITAGTLPFSSNITGTTYQWTNSNPSIGLAASGTGQLPSFTAASTATQAATATITVIPNVDEDLDGDFDGCIGPAKTFVITVSPTTSAIVPANQYYCNGTPVPAGSLNFSSTPPGATFSWTNSNTSIGLGANGMGNSLPAFTATNAGTVTATATITVTPSLNGCGGIAHSFIISVKPTPTITVPANHSYCNGIPVPAGSLSFTSSIPGTTFTWTNSNTSIGLGASGSTSSLPLFTAINTGTVAQTATITVSGSANGCISTLANQQSFTITVNPTPIININPMGPVSLCQGNTQILTASGSSNNYAWSTGLSTSSITVANAGTYTVTGTNIYTCSASTSVVVTVHSQPNASISYAAPQAFCNNVSGTMAVLFGGTITATGTFSTSPGLLLDTNSGTITPQGSTAGIYTITYTIIAAGGCATYTTSTVVTIHNPPSASLIYGFGAPLCTNGNPVTPTLTTSEGGTSPGLSFSSSPAGLNIHPTTGVVNPSASQPGSYVVTFIYTNTTTGCMISTTTQVQVNTAPTAVISYSGSSFCTNSGTATPSLAAGSAAGGLYSAIPSGLAINPSSGIITPSGSIPAIYTVQYTTPALNGCTATATTNVTITQAPIVTISYVGSPFCKSIIGSIPVSFNGTPGSSGGSYSSTPAGLSLNASNGTITPSTSIPGVYVVSYSIPASGGCSTGTTSTNVTITAQPNATINYSGSPFCKTVGGSYAIPTFGGTVTGTGTFSSSPSLGGALNITTGQINLGIALQGTYTVTYTVVTDACSPYSTNAVVRINNRPTGNITLPEGYTTICNGGAFPVVLNLGGTGPWNGMLNDGQGGTSTFTTNSSPYTLTIAFQNPQNNLTYTYTISSLTDVNCTAAPIDLTGSAVVTVRSSPKVIEATGGGNYCTGMPRAPISFNFSGNPGFTFTIKNLTDNTQFAATLINNNIFTFIPTTDGIYKVIALSDNSGCTALITDMVITRSVQLLPSITPSVTLGIIDATNIGPGTSPTVCNNVTTISYRAVGVPTSGTAPGTYFFKKGAITVSSGLSDTFIDNFPFLTGNPETVTVEFTPNTSTYPCLTAGSSPATSSITITRLPAISYGIVGGIDQSTCPEAVTPPTYALSTAPSGGSGVFNYQWYYAPGNAICAGGSGSIPAGYNVAPGNSTLSTYTPPLSLTGVAGTFGPGSYILGVFVSPAGVPLCGAGQFATNCRLLTVFPKPTVTPLPANQVVCTNAATSVVSFTGTVSGTIYNWTRDNNIGGTNTGTGNVPSFTAINTGNTPITSTYTVIPSANGCTGTAVTFTITVNPAPNVGITPLSQTICNGGLTTPVIFSSTISGTTYSWTRDNNTIGGANNGSGNVASFTGINTGSNVVTTTYTVISSIATGCGTSTRTFTISLNPSPKVQLSGTQNVCFGSSASLTVSYQGSGPLVFSYTVNGTNTTTLTATSSPFQFLVTPGINATYKIVSASDSQCTAQPADIDPAPAIVTVKPLPTATIQASANQTVCQGSSATIPIVFTGSAPYTLTYSDGSSNFVVSSITNSLSLTVTPTITTSYTLISVMDANPCTGNSNSSAVIVVNPTSFGGSAGPNQSLCSLTNSGSVSLSGQTGAVIKWQRSTDGGTTYIDLPGNTTTSQSFTNLSPGIYKYRAIVQSGICASAISDAATITVNVISLVSATPTGPTCNNPGNNGSVIIVGTGGTPPLSYVLSGGALSSPVTNSTGVFNGLSAGLYNYSISDAAACTGITGTVTVINPPPVVLSSLSATNISCFGGINGTLTANASGGTGTKTYSIIAGPVINTTGRSNGIFTGLLAGTYTIQASDANSCNSNIQTKVIVQPAQSQIYDANFSADASALTFTTPTSFTDIVFSIFIPGNAATRDTIQLRKFRNNPYVYSFIPSMTISPIDGITPLDNPRWSLVDPGSNSNFLYLVLNNDPGGVNQIPCNTVGRVSVRLTRNTTNTSNFAITWSNKVYPGETFVNNNTSPLGFSAQ